MSNQQLADGVLANPVNVSEVVFRALSTGMCNYNELNTTIGLEGAMRIIEVWQVVQYNDSKLKYIAEKTNKQV